MTQELAPPFTEATARAKAQVAEDAWNSRNPQRVALAYSEDSEWRNFRDQRWRSYGNENWEFDTDSLTQKRFASINDAPIRASERRL